MAWDEARAWLSGTLNGNLYQNLLDDALARPARNARPLPEGASLHFLDPAKGLDEYPKWSKQYRDVVTNPTH